ncbi:SCO4848 family membrane protein [Nocardioides pakistanensis]
MRLERKHAVMFLLIAAWNVLSYANFARNLAETAASGEDRSAGYYAAHLVLIVVNLAVAAYLAVLGRRAWRATRV